MSAFSWICLTAALVSLLAAGDEFNKAFKRQAGPEKGLALFSVYLTLGGTFIVIAILA